MDHIGSQIKSGHYLALIKSGSKWIKCNDHKVSSTELKNELGGNNYVFVYDKLDSVETLPSQLSSKVNENEVVDQSAHEKDTQEEKVEEEEPGAGESFFNLIESPNVDVNATVRQTPFNFVGGSVKFEEVVDGKVRCGGCLQNFSRIIAHLKNKPDCRMNIDIDKLSLAWTRYLKRRRNDKYEQSGDTQI